MIFFSSPWFGKYFPVVYLTLVIKIIFYLVLKRLEREEREERIPLFHFHGGKNWDISFLIAVT